MYKNILVPIDPSHIEEAGEAIALAEHLKSKSGKITLLSVVEDLPAYVAAQIPNYSLDNARKSTFDTLKKFAKDQELKAKVEAVIGNPATAIREIQKSHDCDLIIISSHKPSTVDYVLGSTASKVVRRAQCPVFVTR